MNTTKLLISAALASTNAYAQLTERPPSQAKPKPVPILTQPAEPEQKPTPKPKPKPKPAPVPAPMPVVSPPAATEASVSVLRQQTHQGIAQAASLVMLTPSTAGKSTLNLSAASYSGESAIGLTFAHRLTEQTFFSLGASTGTQSTNRTLVRVSAGVQF